MVSTVNSDFWLKNFAKFIDHIQTYGRYPDDGDLIQWVAEQRTAYANNTIPRECRTILNSIPSWEWDETNKTINKSTDSQLESFEHVRDGLIQWLTKDGVPHRVNNPAIIKPDGEVQWWLNGQRHRNDGPAVVYPNGDTEYWRYGEKTEEKTHNENAPYRNSDGSMEWRDEQGLPHRDGAPAVVGKYWEQWWQHGKLHRDNGPAVTITHTDTSGDTTEWWFDNIQLPNLSKLSTYFSIKILKVTPRRMGGFGFDIECEGGKIHTSFNNEIHEYNSPAVFYTKNGEKRCQRWRYGVMDSDFPESQIAPAPRLTNKKIPEPRTESKISIVNTATETIEKCLDSVSPKMTIKDYVTVATKIVESFLSIRVELPNFNASKYYSMATAFVNSMKHSRYSYWTVNLQKAMVLILSNTSHFDQDYVTSIKAFIKICMSELDPSMDHCDFSDDMIIGAIDAIHDSRGATFQSILKYFYANHRDIIDSPYLVGQLSSCLKKLVSGGKIIKVGYRYSLPNVVDEIRQVKNITPKKDDSGIEPEKLNKPLSLPTSPRDEVVIEIDD